MACAAAAWIAFAHVTEAPPAPLPSLRFPFPAPPGADLGAGDDPLDAAIAPDGQRVVFVATTQDGPRLWLRDLTADEARPLAGTDGAAYPAWKPGGGAVSFFAGGKLRQIAVADGAVRDLADAPAAGGAAWLPDGSLVFGASSGPLRHLRAGRLANATTLRPGDRAHLFPSTSGDGTLVYVAVGDDGSRVVRLQRAGADDTELVPTGAHAQLVGDQLLHVRDGVLLASRIDPATGQLAGRAAPLANSVAISAAGHAAFAASTRLLVTAPAADGLRELAWFAESGESLGAAGEPGAYLQVRLSPDDRHAAVTSVEPLLKSLDIMTLPLDPPGGPEKLTLALAADTNPVWSPDSSRVIYRSMEDATPALFVRRPYETAAPIERGPQADDTPTDWRGRQLLVTSRQGTTLDVHAVDRASGTRTPIAATGFNESDGRWSPDGRWVAFVSDESGQSDVYAVRDGARTRVSFAGGSRPRWRADGGALFLTRGDEILRADLVGGRFTAPVPVVTVPGLRDVDAAHRSRRLLILRSTGGVPVRATAIVQWATPLATAQAPPARR